MIAATETETDTDPEATTGDNVAWVKLFVTFAIFVSALLSVLAPLRIMDASEDLFSVGNMLASGVLFAAGLTHQLADAGEALDVDGGFPWAEFIAGLTFIGFLILEESTHLLLGGGHDHAAHAHTLGEVRARRDGDGEGTTVGGRENKADTHDHYGDDHGHHHNHQDHGGVETELVTAAATAGSGGGGGGSSRSRVVRVSIDENWPLLGKGGGGGGYLREKSSGNNNNNNNHDEGDEGQAVNFLQRMSSNRSSICTEARYRRLSSSCRSSTMKTSLLKHTLLDAEGDDGTRADDLDHPHGHEHEHEHMHHHHDDHISQHLHGSTLASLVLLMALSVHSVLEGVAIGIVGRTDELTATVAAVLAHKVFAGYALGSAAVSAEELDFGRHVAFAFVFASATPLGVVIGAILRGLYDDGGRSVSIVKAMVAGTFLYVAIVEVAMKELLVCRRGVDGCEDDASAKKTEAAKLVAFLVGFLAMSSLAIFV